MTLAERRRWSVARIRCWPSTVRAPADAKRPLRPTVVRASERQRPGGLVEALHAQDAAAGAAGHGAA